MYIQKTSNPGTQETVTRCVIRKSYAIHILKYVHTYVCRYVAMYEILR